MKKLVLAALLAAGIALSGCHSTNAGVVCNDVNPWGASVTRAVNSSGIAVCEGRTVGGRYYWHVRMSDHKITYSNFVPF